MQLLINRNVLIIKIKLKRFKINILNSFNQKMENDFFILGQK